MQNNPFFVNLFRGIYKRTQQFFSIKNKKAGLSWFDEKFLKHAAPGTIRKFNYKKNKIYYSNPSEFLHTFKELFIYEIYKADLQPDSYIIDCGANIGLSVLYFKTICPTAEIIAFEPDEKNFDLLSRNIHSLNLKKVTAKKEAAWTDDSVINFSNEGTMGSKIEIETTKNTHVVKTSRLLNYINQEVDFLKIDIEGAEYQVLKDISPALPLVKKMFFEYHGRFDQAYELTEIFQLIHQAGFRYYIKEAAEIYISPFISDNVIKKPLYDIQLNIFCFR